MAPLSTFTTDFPEVIPLTPIISYGVSSSPTPSGVSSLPSQPLTVPSMFQDNHEFLLDPVILATNPFLHDYHHQPPPKLSVPLSTSMGASRGQLSSTRWLSETPLRQRGLRLKPDDERVASESFVVCQLCGNRILANREVNLRNHARRHATLKQFQCRHCVYKHSEITKVRLHMAHKHDDPRTRPVNNINGEMRHAWRALMHDCFPQYFDAPQTVGVESKRVLGKQRRVMVRGSGLLFGGVRKDCL